MKDGKFVRYYSDGSIDVSGEFINEKPHGYWESYYYNGNLCYKGSFINDNKIGFWIWGYSDGLMMQTKFYAK